MKKKFLCLFLGIWLCLSFTLSLYAIDGTIIADDDAELVTPTLEMTTIPTGAAAVAYNLNTEQEYYYRINGNILSNNDNEVLSEPGWMPESASIDSVIPPVDDRALVTNTQVSPYSAISCIIVYYSFSPLVFSYGTATMISPNVAITAAHNLYDRDYGWPLSIVIYPGVSGNLNRPFGYTTANEVAISIPFYEHEKSESYNLQTWGASHDWGVIRLNDNIGNNSGYLGFQCGNSAVNLMAMISGYPGDLNGYDPDTVAYSTYNQYKHSGVIQSDTSSQTTCENGTTYENRILEFWIDATKGQSGSPILYSNNGSYQIIGIFAVEYGTDHNAGFGLTSQVFHFLVSYKSNSA